MREFLPLGLGGGIDLVDEVLLFLHRYEIRDVEGGGWSLWVEFSIIGEADHACAGRSKLSTPQGGSQATVRLWGQTQVMLVSGVVCHRVTVSQAAGGCGDER
ncbi:hypothetical protein E2C01_027822 [Portunus trituberculatus]|uniref:Uncharacterized protein n=1 Tax=Portunus trituberculatus TaxID=210409 RepID=A0A5B7EIV9_PORTR|nr:hypothetical protein [Portunus trituberculatus]